MYACGGCEGVFKMIIAGFVSGLIGGMGIGGGTVLIPVLTLLFGMEQKTAQALNILYFIPTAIAAIIMHRKNNLIETKILPALIVGGVVGAIAGSVVAMRLNNAVLSKLFAVFLLIMGIKEIYNGLRKT
jgi:hypothetical protein